jgi:hypothetical protein
MYPDRAAYDAILKPLSKAVVSFYMNNIPADVVRCQRAVLDRFVPPDFIISQEMTGALHAAAIDQLMADTQHDLVVILDIDCIPLTKWSIPSLAMRAACGELAGCAQRANHIANQGHLYVGAFCMALTRRMWQELGRPSFQPTARGDVGEELTYRCEALRRPIHLMWPSSVETPLWDLTEDQAFGLNTEYDGAFLHTFGIRDPANQSKFVERCRSVLATGTEPCEPPAAEAGNSNSGFPASDKFYWHRYIPAYERAFATLGEVTNVLEFGVLDGASIRWLADRFPRSRIVGVDITAPRPAWPRSDRIEYAEADQGNPAAIAALFARFGRCFDLIIDDGSHLPPHQAICLVTALPFVRPGGLYILEDVHTSHPDNPDFRQHNAPGTANCLHVLLAMQHLKDCGRQLTRKLASTLGTPGYFSREDLTYLYGTIETIELFKRTSLPLRCYACGSSAFDYRRLRCQCGVNLYAAADSMSFLIHKRAT